MLDGLLFVWAWHPGTLALLLILSLLYMLGVRRAKLHYPQDTSIRTLHIVAFFLAILIAAFMLLTPVDTIGRTQLFSVHMAQVVILTTLCTPLILYSCPEILLRPLTETPGIREILGVLTHPLVASLLFNLTFLFWHVPRIYDRAQPDATLYQVEMLSIFLMSLLNWGPLIGPERDRHHMGYPLKMLYAFFDGQPVDIFAFVLVFTGVALYKLYMIPPQLNLTPFADQTVAGALLLIPGLVDLIVMTPLFFRWLNRIEQDARLADQRRQEAAYEEEEYEEYEEEEEELQNPSEGGELREHLQG
ncbi:MAG: cytochrome c oxidase assembly protein [Ktedonobacteraceae bacterium]|nr:cytochrome c oxidase assembly protein [Ktedonobacteraceae bacterium]